MSENTHLLSENLKQTKFNEIEFKYTRQVNGDGTENIAITPTSCLDDEFIKFNVLKNNIGDHSAALLMSKKLVGIKHRTGLFKKTFATFKKISQEKDPSINKSLTLQTLNLDLITKLGIIVEDFIGMCNAIKEYNLKKTDIAQTYLSSSDPRSKYNHFTSNTGKKKIKQLFNFPSSHKEIRETLNKLDDAEVLLIEKAINASTDYIFERIKDISSCIIINESGKLTYYDIYNKIKHGFSPLYLFAMPLTINIQVESKNTPIEDIISEYYFDSISFMHNDIISKTKNNDKDKEGWIPSFTSQDSDLKSAEDMLTVVSYIEELYLFLVDITLLRLQGDKKLRLITTNKFLSDNESHLAKKIVEDELRYS